MDGLYTCRSYLHGEQLFTCVGIIHMWKGYLHMGLFMCGGAIHMQGYSYVEGLFMHGDYSHVEGYSCVGSSHVEKLVGLFTCGSTHM